MYRVLLIVVLLLPVAGCVVGPEVVGFKATAAATWPSDLPRRYIAIDGVRVAISEMGYGEPDIVLLSGLGGSTNDWQFVAPLLAEKHRVIIVDWPGFGDSQRPPPFPNAPGLQSGQRADREVQRGWAGPDHVSVPYYSGLIPQILDAVHSKEAVVAGHSLGGHILAYHISRPDCDPRILCAVLISPAGMGQTFPDNQLAQVARQRDDLLPLVVHAVRWVLVVRQALGMSPPEPGTDTQTVSLTFDGTRETVRRHYELTLLGIQRMAGSEQAPSYLAAFIDAATSIPTTKMQKRLKNIHMPVLVIGGENDQVVPPPYHEAYAKGIEGAEYVCISKCGHVPPVECPKVTAEWVLGFAAWVNSVRTGYGGLDSPTTQPAVIRVPCDPGGTR